MKTTKISELRYAIRGKEERAPLGGQSTSSSLLAMPDAADIEFEPPRTSITLTSVEFE